MVFADAPTRDGSGGDFAAWRLAVHAWVKAIAGDAGALFSRALMMRARCAAPRVRATLEPNARAARPSASCAASRRPRRSRAAPTAAEAAEEGADAAEELEAKKPRAEA